MHETVKLVLNYQQGSYTIDLFESLRQRHTYYLWTHNDTEHEKTFKQLNLKINTNKSLHTRPEPFK